jgi:hypothetical protein
LNQARWLLRTVAHHHYKVVAVERPVLPTWRPECVVLFRVVVIMVYQLTPLTTQRKEGHEGHNGVDVEGKVDVIVERRVSHSMGNQQL